MKLDLGGIANLSRRNSKNKLVWQQNDHQLVIPQTCMGRKCYKASCD